MGKGITNSILLMLVIMLSINVGLTFTQEAVNSFGSDLVILNENNSPLTNYYTGSNMSVGVSKINESYIPQDENIEVGDTGNIFTDTYTALKTYVSTGLSTVGFLINVLSQPAGFLKDVGVNSAIALGVQIIWSMMFVLLITAWIMGRS